MVSVFARTGHTRHRDMDIGCII